MVPSLVFFADEKNEFQEDARLSPKGGAKSALEPVLLSVFSLLHIPADGIWFP